MTFLSLALLFLALVVSALVAFRKRGLLSSTSGSWPFYAKRPLSQPEQVLYHRLVSSLPDHIVLAQVQVSRVLGVKRGFNFNEWNNRINRMSYDFVICGKDSTVLAAIELDDKSHDSDSRAETDKRKEMATAAAGIRLIRWHVKSLPDEIAIRGAFAEMRPNPSIDGTAASKPVSANHVIR